MRKNLAAGLLTVATAAAATAGDPTAGPNHVVAVRGYALPSGKVEVRIVLERPPEVAPSGFRIVDPEPMIVVDLADTVRGEHQKHVALDLGPVRGIELNQADDGVRVVIGLEDPVGYRAFAEGEGVTILLGPVTGR